MIADFFNWLDGYTQQIEDITGLLIFTAMVGVTGYVAYLRCKKAKRAKSARSAKEWLGRR